VIVGIRKTVRVAEEWFRLPDWDAEARAEFERRLARARSFNRAQYLRIKGLSLHDVGELDGARSLWHRVLEEEAGADDVTVQAASALEHLGDSFASEDPLAAVDFYERSLEGVRLGRGTTCTQHVKMAELLLKEPTPSNVERAADLLARWPDETQLPFPNAHFRWNLAVVELAQTVGDRKAAQEAARRALDLAGRGPVFPRHNTVGIVQTDRRTLKRLARLAK
jgi:tetratricopeptide (TPR) repeat protein